MENSIKATVFDIQRCSLNDGPGIRTTVFVKGCPLRCVWCHNPESYSTFPEIMLIEEKCIGCGDCFSACPLRLHSIKNGAHLIKRSECIACGKCADACTGAITLSGKEMTPAEVMDIVVRDMDFYESSGGGLTLSGGEPLLSHAFTLQLLKLAKERGIHTCIETSGFAGGEVVKAVSPFVDIFLYDYKESDPKRHREYTGVDQSLILSNLELVCSLGKTVVLRCPIIPGFNDRDEHFEAIGKLAQMYDSIVAVNVEPYHPMGENKLLYLGKEKRISLPFTEKDTELAWIEAIGNYTSKPVSKS